MNNWIDECWRLAIALLFAVIAGLVSGHLFVMLTLMLALYSAWMIYRLHELHTWLAGGAKTSQTPDTVGIMSVIAQLIHRERKLRQRQKNKLRETLQQFQVMASELPDATIVVDNKMMIQWCNTAAATLFGISQQRDAGQRIDNLIRLPEFHNFMLQADKSAELEIQSPLNAELTILLSCVPAGKNMQILSGRDITQRVRVREMRKAFVADVSHELRTPLTVITGHMEMLMDGEATPEQKHALSRVSEQTDRMGKIVNDLLTLSKFESSVLRDDQGEAVNIPQSITAIVDDMRSTRGKDHIFNTDIDPELWLMCMESEIYSACQNLIQNAVAYTEPGTRIDISWKRYTAEQTDALAGFDRQGACFQVIDHGPGIDSQHIPRLSERFYRVDTSRSRESGGTGLGLAIVKYIMQRHGGQLGIESRHGEGSTFTLFFPQSRVQFSTDDNRLAAQGN